MPAPHSQLILDEIRQAALPQRLSLGLTWTHAAVVERLSRGENRSDLVGSLCDWLEQALDPWKCAALVDLGDGPTTLSKSHLQGAPANTLLAALNQDSTLETIHPLSQLSIDPEAWAPVCPDSTSQYFICFRVGTTGMLVLTADQRYALTPPDKRMASLIAASVAFIAAQRQAAHGEETPATQTPAAGSSPLGQLACHAALADSVGDAFCLLSPSGEIVEASPAAAKLLGIAHADLPGTPISQFGATAESKKFLQKIAQDGKASSTRLCLRRHPDGREVWAVASALALSEIGDLDPGSADTLLLLRNVSGENLLTQKLTGSREQLKAAAASPSLLLIQIDRRGAILSAEGGALAAADLQTTDLVGRNAWSFCPDTAIRVQIWRQLRRAGQATATLATEHGAFEVTLAACLGPNGRPRSVHGIAVRSRPAPPATTDSAAESSTASNGSSPDSPALLPPWAATFYAATEAVVIVDAKGLIRFVNLAAERLFSIRFAEAEGQPIDRVGSFGELAPLANFLAKPPKPGALHQVRLQRHDGEALELSLAVAPLQSDPSQGFILWCRQEKTQGTAKDLAQEIHRLEKENFKALSTFAGGIAHDFNNILTSLVGNVSLANMLVTGIPEASERLVEAERACFRAKDLSHQLLTFAKGGTPIKKVIRLEDLIQQCAEFYLRGSKAAPRIVLKPGLWSVDVDEGQLSQVLENLILNADHSMPHGGVVTITGENFHHERSADTVQLPLEPGLYVKVSITDEGPGIPENQLTNIFKPYHTANESGRGLGLATTFTIIRNHGGYISANSSIGNGTTFTFYLAATGKTKQPCQEAIKMDPSQGTDADAGRVLVIDDEKSIRDLASTTLKLMGCDVVTCASSSDGVERFITESRNGDPFDLVIMDLTIPGDMGGNEAMQQILNVAPQARGIASSGYSEGSVMAHYREYGFQAALSKPYNIGDLQRMVSNMLNG